MLIQSASRAIIKTDTYIYGLNKMICALILQNPSIMLCRWASFLLMAWDILHPPHPQSLVFLLWPSAREHQSWLLWVWNVPTRDPVCDYQLILHRPPLELLGTNKSLQSCPGFKPPKGLWKYLLSRYLSWPALSTEFKLPYTFCIARFGWF